MSSPAGASAPAFVGTGAAASSSAGAFAGNSPSSASAGRVPPVSTGMAVGNAATTGAVTTTTTTTKVKSKKSSRAASSKSSVDATAAASSTGSTAAKAAGAAAGSNWSTEMEESLTCVICLASPLLDPVTTPCGHSFDKACLDVAMKSDPTMCCPVCRKLLPLGTSFQVSIVLRDTIDRLFPKELQLRREGAAEDDLKTGRITGTTLDWIAAKIAKCSEGGGDGRALLADLRRFTEGVCRNKFTPNDRRLFEPASAEILPTKILKSTMDAIWTLLKIDLNDSKNGSSDGSPTNFGELLDGLPELLDRLVKHTLCHQCFPPQQGLDTVAKDSLEQLACIWSLPKESGERGNTRMHCLFVGCKFIEVVLASMKTFEWRLAWNDASQAFGIFGALLKELKDSQASLGTSSSTTSTSAMLTTSTSTLSKEAATRVLAAQCLEHVSSMASRLVTSDWRQIRQDMSQALVDETSLPCVFALAEVMHRLLNMLGPFEMPGGHWIATSLRGTQKHLMSTAVAADYETAIRLLRLLGTIHVSLRKPYSEDILKSFVGDGRWHTSCGIVDSASKATVNGMKLTRQALSTWIDLVKFLEILGQGHAEMGLAECQFKLVTFLLQTLSHSEGAAEVKDLAIKLLDELITLLESMTPKTAAAVLEPLRWNKPAVNLACGLDLADKDRTRLHKKIGGKLIRAGILPPDGSAIDFLDKGKTTTPSFAFTFSTSAPSNAANPNNPNSINNSNNNNNNNNNSNNNNSNNNNSNNNSNNNNSSSSSNRNNSNNSNNNINATTLPSLPFGPGLRFDLGPTTAATTTTTTTTTATATTATAAATAATINSTTTAAQGGLFGPPLLVAASP